MWGSVDHLQTLSTLLRSGDGVRPLAAHSLCRAAVENASLALWLIAPEDHQTRLGRALRLAAADRRDQSRSDHDHRGADPSAAGVPSRHRRTWRSWRAGAG